MKSNQLTNSNTRSAIVTRDSDLASVGLSMPDTGLSIENGRADVSHCACRYENGNSDPSVRRHYTSIFFLKKEKSCTPI